MSTESKLRSLLSLNQHEYDHLMDFFDPLIKEKLSVVTLKGQLRLFRSYDEPVNSSLYGSKAKLDFILMYLKENPNQCFHGELFGMSQSKVSEWISYLLPVLEKALNKIGVMPQTGYQFKELPLETDCLLVDVTERQVPRDVDYDNQKEAYSGKKKLHTMKNLAITDHRGYILFISESYDGSVHDKSIWDKIHFEFKELNLLADLGFAGIDKEHQNVILPYKKTKNRDITPLQKEINKAIGSARVIIEHAFSGVKRLKIVRDKIRLKTYQVRNSIFKIATALHNLRQTFRSIQNNS